MATTAVQQPEYRRYPEPKKLELMPEEIKAWQDCVKNSTVVTPGLISAAIGYGLFRITPFRAQAKYAAVVAGVLGLISGRIAISSTCLEKVASMTNSDLKERLIEAGFYGNKRISERLYQGFQSPDMISENRKSDEPSTKTEFDDYLPMNTFDTYSSFNDSGDFHVSEDIDLTEPINVQKGVTYDELRNKNRDEFYQKNKQRYNPKMEERYSPKNTTNQQHAQQNAPTNISSIQEKNKYGDLWG